MSMHSAQISGCKKEGCADEALLRKVEPFQPLSLNSLSYRLRSSQGALSANVTSSLLALPGFGRAAKIISRHRASLIDSLDLGQWHKWLADFILLNSAPFGIAFWIKLRYPTASQKISHSDAVNRSGDVAKSGCGRLAGTRIYNTCT